MSLAQPIQGHAPYEQGVPENKYLSLLSPGVVEVNALLCRGGAALLSELLLTGGAQYRIHPKHGCGGVFFAPHLDQRFYK